MPFRDGVFYAYPTHPSPPPSGTTPPSLLHSPLSQSSSKGYYSSAHPASMTPPSSSSAGVPPAQPFRFQQRREPVDWRVLGGLSIERVVSEVDVESLQRHVNAVTFCSVEAERCERCQSAVDPTLLKLFRLAQLTVEWLLHCQAFLARNLQATEERVEASERGRETLAQGQKALEEAQRAQLSAQREKAKAAQRRTEQKAREMMAELEQREKIIRTQQSMFAPGVISNRKCPHCDKSFINAGFLQNHMQRRHPDEYDTQLQSDSDSRLQVDKLRKENVGLKEQLITQQQTLLLKAEQEKEHQCKYNDLQKELDHLKALEAAWRREDSRDRDNRDSRDRDNRDRDGRDSRDRDSRDTRREEVDRELQTHAIFKLEQRLKEQDRKWESRMQEIKVQHESEKDQDRKWESRMQEMEDQHESEKSQWWDDHRKRSDRTKELERKLREKEVTIAAQREQMKKISSNPSPAKPAKTPPVILTAAAPEEPKAKRVLLMTDSSSISSERPAVKKRSEKSEVRRGVTTANALRRNPNIRKELRPVLENALREKMEHLGVKGQRGLSGKELRSILALLHSDRENTARSTPDYWLHREAVTRALEARVRQGARDHLQGTRDHLQGARDHQGTRDHVQGARDHQGTRDSHPTEPIKARAKYSPQASQSRPQTGVLRSGHVTQVVQQVVRTPQPAPRSRPGPPPAPTKTSTPHSYSTTTGPRTSPFSSEEESEEEDEASLGGPASKPGAPASKLGGPASRQQTQPKQQATPPTRGPAVSGAVTRTAVTTLESEEEWSDVSELREIHPVQPHAGTDRRKGDAPRAVEQGVGDRGHKRPIGGVRVLPERKDAVQELMCTDLEDCSDWVSSSLEDEASKALKKSLDSSSTSVWGTSTGKNHRSGPTDAGTTGSTLKSSLVSLSDLSDSEDI